MRKKIYQLFFFIFSTILFGFVSGFAQQSVVENKSKVGGLKLQDRGFGLFATARHVNQDSAFTNYVNYSARFSLWVGAVTSKGEILVTAGTGNENTRRPEWTPIHPSFEVTKKPPFPQVEKIISLSYWDGVPFDGHKPLGLQVELRIYNALGQLVRTLVNRPYQAGTFSVTWKGRDDEGQPLPSGIYFYRIKAGDFQAQRKLLLLK